MMITHGIRHINKVLTGYSLNSIGASYRLILQSNGHTVFVTNCFIKLHIITSLFRQLTQMQRKLQLQQL